ncbi:uncharacterized protein LOC111268810 [Varroa jacobsoni]|uniref:uncharacterized protein LOC111268810 n=1 Tax=Varroa jacobsoni TaxID=62625 RepID=UPI000BF54104|nr:uncharacterized protein LOC111268810 [Varroa jacobsoni]
MAGRLIAKTVPTDQMWSTITINLCALQSASKVHYPSSPTARVWHAVMYYHSAIFLLPLLLCRSRNIISQNDDCSSCGGSGRDNDGDDIGRKKASFASCTPIEEARAPRHPGDKRQANKTTRWRR